jgi:predicted phosphodiesterase
MKTVIFSDTHLGHEFSEKKYRFLEGIIKDADKVIINGDFWDKDFTTFEKFTSSQWRHLFPVLKEKETVYLYGNHDSKIDTNENVGLFSSHQTIKYTLPLKDNKVAIFEHGDRLIPFNNLKKIPKTNTLRDLGHFIEDAMINHMRDFLIWYLRRLNEKMKLLLRKELKKDEIYICGHTHCAEFDFTHAYVNSGVIRHGLGQYLEINDGVLSPKEEWYE